MGWTLVQKRIVSGSAAQSSLAYNSDTTAGNLLLAIPGMNVTSQSTLPTVSSFTKAEERLGTDCGIGIWYDLADSGPRSVQASGLTGSMSLAISEWSYTAAGNATADKNVDNAATAGTSITGTLPTLSTADELLIMAVRLSGASTAPRSWTNSFTEQDDMNSRGSWASRVVSATTSVASTYSWTGTLNSALAAASFRAVSTPLVNKVKVRESNAFVAETSKVRISNAWVTIT